jgi:SPP1 family predicted phage head-tail adaptor
MTPAGNLEQKVRFERRSTSDDGYGNVETNAWVEVVTRSAAFKAMPGRERLEAGRLESTVDGILTVRRCSTTETVLASDRIVFLRGPYAEKTAQIRSIQPSYRGDELEMVVEIGVAT